MKGTTHLAVGIAAAATLQPGILPAVLLCVGSLAPDLDEEHSILGRYNPLAKFFMKHRGLLHFWGLMLLVAAVEYTVFQQMPWFSFGVLLHLFLDALNPMGVPILWPAKKRFRFPITVASSSLFANISIQVICIFVFAVGMRPTIIEIGAAVSSFFGLG